MGPRFSANNTGFRKSHANPCAFPSVQRGSKVPKARLQHEPIACLVVAAVDGLVVHPGRSTEQSPLFPMATTDSAAAPMALMRWLTAFAPRHSGMKEYIAKTKTPRKMSAMMITAACGRPPRAIAPFGAARPQRA
ncbi:MAG: hypothetical protein Q7S40_21385 [Opitutaceae bacterium]|nr:hypothetical protein [Opitutaceae bacterium]